MLGKNHGCSPSILYVMVEHHDSNKVILFVSVQWIIFASLSSVALAGLNLIEKNSWNERIRVIGIKFASDSMKYFDTNMS